MPYALHIVILRFAHCYPKVCISLSYGLYIVILRFAHCYSKVCISLSYTLCSVIKISELANTVHAYKARHSKKISLSWQQYH